MWGSVLGGFLVVHGLITGVIGASIAARPANPGLPNAAWLGWWPIPLGRSWLLDGLHLGTGAAVTGGLLWLVAGLGLLAGGLGRLGAPGLHGSWQALALGGAALGLLALALYFHPWYALATLLNAAILVGVSGVLGRVMAGAA